MNVHSIRLLAAAAVGGAFLWLASAFGGPQDVDGSDWRVMNEEVAAWLDGSTEAPVGEESADSEDAPLPPAPNPADVEAASASAPPTPAEEPTVEDSVDASGLVDINRATIEQLDALPGIGPAKARAIVEYREANGPFATTEALTNVKGIGPAIFEKIRASISVGRAEPDAGTSPGGK